MIIQDDEIMETIKENFKDTILIWGIEMWKKWLSFSFLIALGSFIIMTWVLLPIKLMFF